MTHKNIFLSLFVLANIGSLFSMEKPNQIFTKKTIRPMTPMDKKYPDHLKNKLEVEKRRQAMKNARSKNNRRQKDTKNSTVNNSNPTINNQIQKSNTSI